MKLFPSAFAASVGSAKKTAVFQDNNDPQHSKTTMLSSRLFSRSPGLDTTHLTHLLHKTIPDRAQQLRQRLDQQEKELGVTSTALGQLLPAKNDLDEDAIKEEKGLRTAIAEVQGVYQIATQEREAPERTLQKEQEDGAEWQEQLQCLTHERDEYRTHCMTILVNLNVANAEVGKLQLAVTLLETQLVEANKQKETVRTLAKCMGEELSDEKRLVELTKELKDCQGELETVKVSCLVGIVQHTCVFDQVLI